MGHYSHDFLKAYPFRFCGYGFGMAEAVRGTAAPTVVRGLYMVASGFVFARTLYKPFQISKVHIYCIKHTIYDIVSLPKTQSPVKIVLWTADTFVYEIIASGAVPVFTASLIKSVVSTVLPAKTLAGPARLWTPAVVSLMSLPFVIPFTDTLLDTVMNETIRQIYS
ncbi:unnamed protein product [Candidula unifasciata]|uniref:Mitochondrial fission process protein 1 n=1 Tax=Candidula unifasciata TaxID=100452 RepID=A0A8S3YNJ8_9EUPU|nr:unnamed protein product [Candidula unifasciata]